LLIIKWHEDLKKEKVVGKYKTLAIYLFICMRNIGRDVISEDLMPAYGGTFVYVG
jgi:hypothetical protein